jgi:four helix bundle protein
VRIDRFEDMATWQLADELRREVLAFTAMRPAAMDFKYCAQIRDASSSACRDAAEGFARFRPSEFARFLEFARGSLAEVQDGLLEAHARRFLADESFDRLWLLSKRAIGANTNLLKYLRGCIASGDSPWRKPRQRASEPPPRPGT